MTYAQAAQSAIDCQNACNASGIIRSLKEAVSGPIWAEANRRFLGTQWVNTHPIITLFLCKIGELNGSSLTSLSPDYKKAEEICILIASGAQSEDEISW